MRETAFLPEHFLVQKKKKITQISFFSAAAVSLHLTKQELRLLPGGNKETNT